MTHRPAATRILRLIAPLALAGALAACTPPQGTSVATSEAAATAESSASAESSTTATPTTQPTSDGPAIEGVPDGVTFVTGLPTGVTAADGAVAGAGWSSDGTELFVTTIGSTSCPLVAISYEATDGRITVETTQAGGAVCTQDSTPTTTTFAAPGEPAAADVVVVVGELGEVTVPVAADPIAYGWITQTDEPVTEPTSDEATE